MPLTNKHQQVDARAAEQAAAMSARPKDDRDRAAERDRQAFLVGPVGRAAKAFDRGDQVFQVTLEIHSQQGVAIAMIGTTTRARRSSDPCEVLNAICSEGWELLSGSFVFVESGSISRDRFLTSGEQVAMSGQVIGYYLFRRAAAAAARAIDADS